jgi:hypothetical protein
MRNMPTPKPLHEVLRHLIGAVHELMDRAPTSHPDDQAEMLAIATVITNDVQRRVVTLSQRMWDREK